MRRIWEDFFERSWIMVGLFIATVLGCISWAEFVFSR